MTGGQELVIKWLFNKRRKREERRHRKRSTMRNTETNGGALIWASVDTEKIRKLKRCHKIIIGGRAA